jgi:NAD+ kinase
LNNALDHQVTYIQKYFEEKGFQVDLWRSRDLKFGQKANLPERDYKFALVAGGDGTVLYAAAVLRGTAIPIASVNFGHLGFLTSFESNQIEESFEKLANFEFTVESRNILDVSLDNRNDFALNETGLFKTSPSKMIKVVVFIDQKEFGSFACDGVVVATASGSTAYNYANGGAIMWPDVEAMQLTVLAGQTHMPLPLVVSKNSQFSLSLAEDSKSDAMVINDGFREHQFGFDHTLTVKFSDQTTDFVSLEPLDFSKRLIEKLG